MRQVLLKSKNKVYIFFRYPDYHSLDEEKTTVAIQLNQIQVKDRRPETLMIANGKRALHLLLRIKRLYDQRA